MRATGYIAAMSLVGAICAGCAKEPEPAPIAPVRIEVTKSDFCEIMLALFPASAGKPTWSTRDTPETITGSRRIAAAIDKKKCVKPRPETSNTKPTS